MKIKFVQKEDFINYKKPSFVVGFPYCTFKCDKEAGCQVCQNSTLATMPTIELSAERIVGEYENSDIAKSICFCGLEPMDSFNDVVDLITTFRNKNINDAIVIYSGYNKDEIQDKIDVLKQYKNIIVKYGRFIPNDIPRYDDVLGIMLASSNQYAEQIS